MWRLLERLLSWHRARAEAARVRAQKALVGRVVLAVGGPGRCSCARKLLAQGHGPLWRLTGIVVDDGDYHAVPFGKEEEWGSRYEYICPRGFELMPDEREGP